MVSNFKDDEAIVDVEMIPSADSDTFKEEKTTAIYYNRLDAPLEETRMKVVLELTGSETGNDRHGLDLVTVLDVSLSMRGSNLKNLKIAMKFLIKKLSPIDRLSIVTFSTDAHRLCPLRQMTPAALEDLDKIIDGLVAHGYTNISAGLETAVQVLDNRRYTGGRSQAIMLMSDGKPQPPDADGSNVIVNGVQIHTFGLGQKYNPKVLEKIAKKVKGGTFSTADIDNPKTSNLSVAFSQCLGGLLNVTVKNLTLTIKQGPDTKIEKIYAGEYYPESMDQFDGSAIISFGNLYSKEIRRILVDVLLPAVDSRQGTEVLTFSYSYDSLDDKSTHVLPIIVDVERTDNPKGEDPPEVKVEEARLKTAGKMKEARILADDKKYEQAKNKLNEAKDMLNGVNIDKNKYPEIEMLKEEVQQLFDLMEPGTYEKVGRAFALASELSHGLQRFASRGDAEKLRTFASGPLDTYLKEVLKHVETSTTTTGGSSKPDAKPDPPKPVDPLAAIAKPLSEHLEKAMLSLQKIQEMLDKLPSGN